jgi:DNA-binding NarL/FixJ family response regulator
MKKPTVVIAEDDAVIREGCLCATLEPFFEIVAAVDNGEAAVASVERHKPDIVLLDVSLPVLRGFDAARRILAKQPEIILLFVSNYSDRAYVEEASRIGAAGYVLKTRAFAELTDAIYRALAGEFYRPAI